MNNNNNHSNSNKYIELTAKVTALLEDLESNPVTASFDTHRLSQVMMYQIEQIGILINMLQIGNQCITDLDAVIQDLQDKIDVCELKDVWKGIDIKDIN